MPEYILKMAFEMPNKKVKVFTIQPCKSSITAAEIKSIMNDIIDSDCLVWRPTKPLGAKIEVTDETKLF